MRMNPTNRETSPETPWAKRLLVLAILFSMLAGSLGIAWGEEAATSQGSATPPVAVPAENPGATDSLKAMPSEGSGVSELMKGQGSAVVKSPNDKPAVNTLPTVKKFDLRTFKDVSYNPLPAIAVFPVVLHHNTKAFADASVVFADEFANVLSNKAKGTKVLNPVYTVEELRIRGLEGVYNKIMQYYIKAHRPEPKALNYLLKELSADGRQIQRVAFIEVDFDVNKTTKPVHLVDRLKAISTDGLPQTANYFIRSRVQVFDTVQEDSPMIWAFTWSKLIEDNKFWNVTPSVFQDTDSMLSFARASRWMSREMFVLLPKKVYLQEQKPQIDASVEGEVVP